MVRGFMILAAAVSLTFAAWKVSAGFAGTDQQSRSAADRLTADARQQELLREDLNQPSDAALSARFQSINVKYFSGVLSPIPVVWEPRLAEIGVLAGRSFTLLGVFGQTGDRSIILLHPSLKSDATALDRALCHEMVHAYLFSVGDTSTDHNEAFKSVLRRLSKEGAFISIEASPEERAQLRDYLGREAERLDAERQAMDTLGPELERERQAIQQDVEAMNARVAAANAAGRGFPAPEEINAVNARRDAYNDRAAALNRRSVEFGIAQDEYNRQVSRYNLMTAYPDGMDEATAPVTARPGKGG